MDHGILNTPLRSRGNIDAQIDRYKAEQAAMARAAAKSKAAQMKADREAAHAALDATSEDRIKYLANYCGKSVAAMRKHLASECHWNPKLAIAILRRT